MWTVKLASNICDWYMKAVKVVSSELLCLRETSVVTTKRVGLGSIAAPISKIVSLIKIKSATWNIEEDMR